MRMHAKQLLILINKATANTVAYTFILLELLLLQNITVYVIEYVYVNGNVYGYVYINVYGGIFLVLHSIKCNAMYK